MSNFRRGKRPEPNFVFRNFYTQFLALATVVTIAGYLSIRDSNSFFK